jgi:hypothetical protein
MVSRRFFVVCLCFFRVVLHDKFVVCVKRVQEKGLSKYQVVNECGLRHSADSKKATRAKTKQNTRGESWCNGYLCKLGFQYCIEGE